MTDAKRITIGQIVPPIAALVAAMLAWLQSRANAKRQAADNAASRAAIQEVHLTINSRLTEFKEQSDELLAASIEASYARGKLDADTSAKKTATGIEND